MHPEDILKDVVTLPTASFHETAVIDYVRRFAREHGLPCEADEAGNLSVVYRRGAGAARKVPWVFAAHMDHPAFVATRRAGRTLWADFLGGVRVEYFKGSRVRFRTGDGDVRGTVKATRRKPRVGWLSCRIELDEARSVPGGTVGMWDVPLYRTKGNVVHACACDDLAGVASVLAALAELKNRRVAGHVVGLFTRAEEVGFIGAIAACKTGVIPKHGRLVAIETSAEQKSARLGDGVVIRVGDRTWTFDPALTAHVAAVAAGLAKRDPAFGHTRQLMPGGTCESTAYWMYEYQATGLCLPLGNYHNMGPRSAVRAEKIDVRDYRSLVKLLVSIASSKKTPETTVEAIRTRLENRLKFRGPHLHSP